MYSKMKYNTMTREAKDCYTNQGFGQIKPCRNISVFFIQNALYVKVKLL